MVPIKVAHARIGERGHDVRGIVGRTVIDDDQLQVGIDLVDDAPDDVTDEGGAIVRWNDDRNSRQGRCSGDTVVTANVLPPTWQSATLLYHTPRRRGKRPWPGPRRGTDGPAMGPHTDDHRSLPPVG